MSTELAPKPTSEELNKQLKAGMRTIDRKLKALGYLGDKGERPTWKTGGTFKYNEQDGNSINIHSASSAPYLGKCLALMYRVKEDYCKAMEGLGLTTYPTCLWMNLDIDHWIHDLEIKVKETVNQNTINELVKSKAELAQFLSQEDKLESTLTRLSALLKA